MNTTLEVYHEGGEDDKFEDCLFDVEFDFSAYYTPARINCRVEDSCPEEGDSFFEIQKVHLDKKELEFSDLPKDVQESINDFVSEWVDENGLQEIADDDAERKGEAQYDAQEDADDFHYQRGY